MWLVQVYDYVIIKSYLKINMAQKKRKISPTVRIARLVSLQISVMALWLMVFAIAFAGM